MIHVKNLRKSYSNVEAVCGIDFSVKKGEVVGILGPNGAGKSSTIRILCGFLSPTSGEVKVGEYRFVPGKEMVEAKHMIGYLPENAPAYNEMMVYDFLHFVYEVRGGGPTEAHAKIMEVIARCGLVEVKHKNISDLSKGYRQRVGLAHALIGDPEILVLDEPTSGLDPNQIVEIRSLIRAIGKEKTVLLCSHILSEVEATCDRVIIIKNGSIVADDLTQNLKKRHSLNQTLQVAFTGSNEEEVKRKLSQVVGEEAIEPYVLDESEEPDAFGFLIRYNKENEAQESMRSRIFQLNKQENWNLIELKRQVESLESVFRELTKVD